MVMVLKKQRLSLIYGLLVAGVAITEIVTSIYFPMESDADAANAIEVIENLHASLIDVQIKAASGTMVPVCREGNQITLNEHFLHQTLEPGDTFGPCKTWAPVESRVQ